MKRIPLPWLLLVLALTACNLPSGLEPQASPTPEPLATPQADARPTPVPLPAPELPAVAPQALIGIDFLDPYNGWGLALDGSGRIVRTVDGGRTWYDATPPGGLPIGYGAPLAVLDALHAWLLIANPDYLTGNLYRSRDGGLTWDSFPVPFGGGSLQFLDADTGFVLADRGAAAGSQSVELFRSLDGGASWTSVYHNDPTRPGSGESLPLGGMKNGMTFLDASTGWVTGSRPMDGDVYLFASRDGGATWSQQALPLPVGTLTAQFVTSPPVFFGSQGFLPLLVYPPGEVPFLTFYTSSDGGLSWQGDPADASRTLSPAKYSFADAEFGFAWDGGRILYQTGDSGRSWDGLAPSIDLTDRLALLDFTSPSNGFALTSVEADGRSQLFQTTDGGSTWTPVVP